MTQNVILRAKSRRISRFILLLTAFLIPLVGVTRNFGYEQAKVFLFIVLTSLSGFVWLLTKPTYKWTPISKASGLFIILLLLTSVTGLNPTTSLLGISPYFQGAILYAYLFLFSLVVSAVKIKLQHWTYVLVGSGTLVGLLAIKEWVVLNIFGLTIPSYAGRVVSTFGQPNFYAGFILLTLPFFYFLLTKKVVRWWLIVGFLVSLVALILSQSRTAYLLLVGLLVLWAILELTGRRFLVFTVSLTIVLVAVFLSIFFSSGLLWKEFIEPRLTINPDLTKASVENRVYIWPIAWQLVSQKPLLGYGLENINQAFSSYFQTNYHALFEENLKIQPVLISLKELNIDRSHNYLLDLLLFSGILGFLSWLFLIVIIFRKLIFSKINPETTTMLIGLCLYLIWIQFQNQSIVHLIYFWLLVGLIDA